MIPYLEAIGLRFRSWFKSKNKSKNNSGREDDWQFIREIKEE
jgi:hypothetical protein